MGKERERGTKSRSVQSSRDNQQVFSHVPPFQLVGGLFLGVRELKVYGHLSHHSAFGFQLRLQVGFGGNLFDPRTDRSHISLKQHSRSFQSSRYHPACIAGIGGFLYEPIVYDCLPSSPRIFLGRCLGYCRVAIIESASPNPF